MIQKSCIGLFFDKELYQIKIKFGNSKYRVIFMKMFDYKKCLISYDIRCIQYYILKLLIK